MIYSLIVSLILTIIIELSTSLILGIRSKNDVKATILVNCFTNPFVVLIANLLLIYENKIVYNVLVNLMEVLVIFVEFKLYEELLKDYKKSPFLLSLINNVISYSMGFIINRFI